MNLNKIGIPEGGIDSAEAFLDAARNLVARATDVTSIETDRPVVQDWAASANDGLEHVKAGPMVYFTIHGQINLECIRHQKETSDDSQ